MSAEDLRTLLKLAREAEIRRDDTSKMKFYIGGNAGTYGVGINVGIIL